MSLQEFLQRTDWCKSGDLQEMAIGPESGHDLYWHGNSGPVIREIAKAGVIKGHDVSKRRSRYGLTPMKGKVYLGTFAEAFQYALFRTRGGGKWNLDRTKFTYANPEAGMVAVDAKSIGKFDPDEDEVADLLSAFSIGLPNKGQGVSTAEVTFWGNDVKPGELHGHTEDQFNLGRLIFNQVIGHDKSMMRTWWNAHVNGDYSHFTMLGKRVLRKLKSDDYLRSRINQVSHKMAAHGDLPIVKAIVFDVQRFDVQRIEKKDKVNLDSLMKIGESLPIGART